MVSICNYQDFSPFQGAILKSRSMPGIATSAQHIKKFSQPIIFARYPVGADIITRGVAIRLLRSAYWVAVNLLSVIDAI